jgi:hypothetical protein
MTRAPKAKPARPKRPVKSSLQADPGQGFDPDELASSELDQIALDAPGRGLAASEHMWRRVAQGEFDADVHKWLRAVAGKILRASEQPAARRRDEVFRATGLHGRRDKQQALRRFVRVLESFEDSEPRKSRDARLHELAVKAKLVPETMTQDEFRKLAARERARSKR